MDFARATITRDIFIPGPTQCGLSRSLKKRAKHTTFYKFEEGICFAEHWKLVAESSEFNLTLKRAHRVHFFQLEIRQKKRDILSEKLESGMALKKREFTPESGTVDTYDNGKPCKRVFAIQSKETYYKNADIEEFLSQEFVCNRWLTNIAVRLLRTGIRGAVRALSRLRHQRAAISRPTRHFDCVGASFANRLATRT